MPLRKNPNDVARARSVSLPSWMWDVLDDEADRLRSSRSEYLKELLLPAAELLRLDQPVDNNNGRV